MPNTMEKTKIKRSDFEHKLVTIFGGDNLIASPYAEPGQAGYSKKKIMAKNQPIIEEITEPNQSHSVHESVIGVSHISNVTVRPDDVAHTIRNILVASGKFENVKYIGNDVIEVMFNGVWYNVEVNGSIGNLFI